MPARTDFAPGEFCWFDLVTPDLAAATAWYGDLFGWTHQVMPGEEGKPPYAFFMKGDAAVGGIGELNEEMKVAGVPPCWNDYIATRDCAATEAKVQELGGTVTVPTTEVPGHGKLAFFLDPEGASFAVWEATGGDGGPGVLVGDPGGVSWTELMTRDTGKATEFYRSLVGWDFADMPMGGVDYVMLKCGEKDAGGMMPMDDPRFDGVPAHWLTYFAVEDCDATTARVASTGGRVNIPPTEIPVGKFSVVRDPQGAVFALIQLAAPAC